MLVLEGALTRILNVKVDLAKMAPSRGYVARCSQTRSPCEPATARRSS